MKIYTYLKILSVLGILLGAYLLWQQMAQPLFKPCNINATINCEAVISGPVAKTLGIPTPLYGLIGYTVILFAAIYKKPKLLLGTTIFGLGFCLWLAYVELFQLRVICPICIACQLIMLTIFILALRIKKSIELADSK